jgi:hypothetical protein
VAAVSDAAAAECVVKLRSALDKLTLSEQQRNIGEVISDYLTWRELIHTSYLYIPRFNKLVAYAVSKLDGFLPTVALTGDPDYATLERWYEEIQPKGAASK